MNILYLCIGNTCRSPLAEYFSKKAYPHHNFQSAGLYPSYGKMSENSEKLLKAEGIVPRNFQSKGLSKDLIQWADYLVPMERSMEGTLRVLGGNKVYTFWDHGGTEIPDPYGAPFVVYQVTYQALKENIKKMMADLEGSR